MHLEGKKPREISIGWIAVTHAWSCQLLSHALQDTLLTGSLSGSVHSFYIGASQPLRHNFELDFTADVA